jgi:hypothetical protein
MWLPFLAGTGSAQLMIDAEQASINTSGDLTDNGRLITWQDNATSVPQIVPGGRMGSSSVQYTANPTIQRSGNDVQRSEHRFAGSLTNLNGDWSLFDQKETFVGFSFKLDQNFEYPSSEMFMNIWQLEQEPSAGGQDNALLTLGTEHESNTNTENWVMRWRWGQGQSGGNSDFHDVGNLQRDVWYDFIVGFRMAAHSPTGWISTWIKDETQSVYSQNSTFNQYIGYDDFEPTMLSTQVGIHRARTSNFAQINFDQVRIGNSFDDVRPVSNVPGDFNIDYVVAGADFLQWQRGDSFSPQSTNDLAVWSANHVTLADPIEYITGVLVSSGGDLEGSQRAAENAVNGNGLVLIGDDTNDPGNYTHNGANNEFGQGNVNWLDQTGGGTTSIDDMWIAVDLGYVYNLSAMNFFNMGTSEGGNNFRGIRQADIYYRTDSLGNNSHLNDTAFDPTGWILLGAAGEQRFNVGPTDGIQQGPDTIDLSGVMARYIALDINSNYGSSATLAGIGELQFFGTAFSGGLSAVAIPEPEAFGLTLVFLATASLTDTMRRFKSAVP